MIFDPSTTPPGNLYRFMIGVVVPRPIAFVSTQSEPGRFNVAPFSYFNAITNRPPLVGISMNARGGGPKDTLRNIRATGDFVINLVHEELLEKMVYTSGDWPADVDEFELTGLTAVESDLVEAPRVGEAKVSLECRLFREISLGDATFVVGEMLLGHVDDDILVDGKVDVERLKPVGRLGGDGYCVVREAVHLARPRVERPAG